MSDAGNSDLLQRRREMSKSPSHRDRPEHGVLETAVPQVVKVKVDGEGITEGHPRHAVCRDQVLSTPFARGAHE